MTDHREPWVRRAPASLWAQWRPYGRRIGMYQTSILLALAYVVLFAPLGLLRAFSLIRFLPYRRHDGSTWLEVRSRQRSLDDLRRPY